MAAPKGKGPPFWSEPRCLYGLRGVNTFALPQSDRPHGRIHR